MSAELPPEVQAVLDAACAGADLMKSAQKFDAEQRRLKWNAIHDAVDAYRKSIAPPEPFDGYLVRFDTTGAFSSAIHPSTAEIDPKYDEVWRVTVTPIERVR